jgi:hypothetical protein
MIALYVDDIPAACNDAAWLASFKARLGARFKIKDLGELSQLLGMHITHDRSARTISLDQSKYLRDILAKYGITDSKPSSLPMDPGFLAGLCHMTSPPLTGVAKDVYPSLLGSLQYAAVCTRPDVSTALSILGSAQASPTDAHLQALNKVLRYLHGTIDMRMTLGGRGRTTVSNSHALPTLTWQTTAAPASLVRGISSPLDAGPSVTSPNNRLVWPNPRVKPSTTLRLMPQRRDSNSANLWGRSSTPPSPKPPPSWRTTKAPLRTPRMVSEKTRHIGLKWHFLKDHVEQGTIKLRYLPTYQMVVDMLTKPLPRPALARHRSAILGGQDPMHRFRGCC